MADHVNMTQANGWFKTSYADKMANLIPDSVYYARQIPELQKDSQPGGNYSVPVTLTSEQGVTKAAAAAGAFALNAPIALSSAQSSIAGAQLVIRSALDYETIYRSKNKNSFIAATKGVVENMIKSAYFYQEADIMWGRSGIGIVSSVAAPVITLTTASWASGLWLGSENRTLRIETSAGVLRGTCSVSSYDIEARQVTVDAVPAGTAGTDVIYFAADGAAGANSMVGLHSAIGTTTGDLWGISRNTYKLWCPATAYSAGSAPLSFNKIMKGITGAANHGLGDDINEIEVVVNPSGWTDLGNDLAALRSIDSSYKSGEAANGSESIKFFCPAGKVEVFPHKCMKEGFAFVHPKCSRAFDMVGAQPKPTFELPGMVANGEKQYLRQMENNCGVETRIYWNAAVFTSKVGQCRLIYEIVNAA